MEELLNKLIEKGWKPFGTDNRVFKVLRTKNNWWYFDGGFGNEICFSLREIVSKESGLWQFVCENGMVEKGGLFWELGYSSGEIDLESRRRRQDYEYRLIRSALIDESELEDFLLQNIRVGNED